jgi:pullulanase/glycogen debranching enzyme
MWRARALALSGNTGKVMWETMKIKPGNPYPLGATWKADGVNFAIFSEHATQVELCLFDSPDARSESVRIPLPEQTDKGQLYGYRIHGPYPHKRATDTIPKKPSWILMPRRSDERLSGARRCAPYCCHNSSY